MDNFNFKNFKKYCEKLKEEFVNRPEDYRKIQKLKERKYYDKKYYQSDKGKINVLRNATKRKRSLGFILMFPNPFDSSVLVDYHHITDAYIVTIPRDLHKLYNGKNHRELCMNVINQIYL